MTVTFLIKKLHGCTVLTCSYIFRKSKLLPLLTSIFLIAEVSALAQVVDLAPETTLNNNDKSLLTRPPLEMTAVLDQDDNQAASNTPTGRGTAYLLGRLEKLSDEVMLLRGQFEEQTHLIKQLQQDNRDRYLDLDRRVTRLPDSSNKPLASPDITNNSMITPSTESDVKVDEDTVYQKALQLIREKHFDDAKKILTQQLITFPKGRYADNAQYWLGEVHMAQGAYPDAKNAFLTVLNNYPNSPKVPDATYKLGHLLDLMANKKQAQKYFETVISKYPDSTAARLSDNYLQRLGDP
ncbi:MAG: tol-pal system protein YbgF [Candidatus Endonucleobacter sp. (ex Gigantidas childressi)]|nr:tol-pal system protein YbgF [Candidatus Endonucleobacter sp. (ex Gigantidas childressi)]